MKNILFCIFACVCFGWGVADIYNTYFSWGPPPETSRYDSEVFYDNNLTAEQKIEALNSYSLWILTTGREGYMHEAIKQNEINSLIKRLHVKND